MPQNVYEGLFIFDSTNYNRDTEGVSRQVPALIEKLGGEILVSRLWEERRLAYSIKGQRKGTYWLLYFRLDNHLLAEIRRHCAINDNILRVLFLKVDPRIVDTLVNHARSAVTLSAPAEGEAPQAETPPAAQTEATPVTEGG
ncbi:MAG: 30S ribosomal protein S6 [Pirellulales bacterium]|nr:30S ribosomal protein S6 [Pirellulales bacterium]